MAGEKRFRGFNQTEELLRKLSRKHSNFKDLEYELCSNTVIKTCKSALPKGPYKRIPMVNVPILTQQDIFDKCGPEKALYYREKYFKGFLENIKSTPQFKQMRDLDAEVDEYLIEVDKKLKSEVSDCVNEMINSVESNIDTCFGSENNLTEKEENYNLITNLTSTSVNSTHAGFSGNNNIKMNDELLDNNAKPGEVACLLNNSQTCFGNEANPIQKVENDKLINNLIRIIENNTGTDFSSISRVEADDELDNNSNPPELFTSHGNNSDTCFENETNPTQKKGNDTCVNNGTCSTESGTAAGYLRNSPVNDELLHSNTEPIKLFLGFGENLEYIECEIPTQEKGNDNNFTSTGENSTGANNSGNTGSAINEELLDSNKTPQELLSSINNLLMTIEKAPAADELRQYSEHIKKSYEKINMFFNTILNKD